MSFETKERKGLEKKRRRREGIKVLKSQLSEKRDIYREGGVLMSYCPTPPLKPEKWFITRKLIQHKFFLNILIV